MTVLDKYANHLWEAFMYDMNVFSEKWMYIPFLIPIAFYIAFFVLKWYVLLFPITLPLSMIGRIVSRRRDDERDYVPTEKNILEEMDEDMNDSGVAQGEIVSLTNHWRQKFVIRRRKRNDD